MEIIKINKKKISPEDINLITDYLHDGKTIAYPTDTIYGLGCDATNIKAIRKIYQIKRRDKDKPLLILVSSYSMLRRYCFLSKKQEEYLKKIWPGKVSVIFKKRKLLSSSLTGGKDTVAVRLPKDDFLIKIIKKINKPLVSTSLNASGQRNLSSISEMKKHFLNHKPSLAIDGGEILSRPSKLIDLSDINNIKILRK